MSKLNSSIPVNTIFENEEHEIKTIEDIRPEDMTVTFDFDGYKETHNFVSKRTRLIFEKYNDILLSKSCREWETGTMTKIDRETESEFWEAPDGKFLRIIKQFCGVYFINPEYVTETEWYELHPEYKMDTDEKQKEYENKSHSIFHIADNYDENAPYPPSMTLVAMILQHNANMSNNIPNSTNEFITENNDYLLNNNTQVVSNGKLFDDCVYESISNIYKTFYGDNTDNVEENTEEYDENIEDNSYYDEDPIEEISIQDNAGVTYFGNILSSSKLNISTNLSKNDGTDLIRLLDNENCISSILTDLLDVVNSTSFSNTNKIMLTKNIIKILDQLRSLSSPLYNEYKLKVDEAAINNEEFEKLLASFNYDIINNFAKEVNKDINRNDLTKMSYYANLDYRNPADRQVIKRRAEERRQNVKYINNRLKERHKKEEQIDEFLDTALDNVETTKEELRQAILNTKYRDDPRIYKLIDEYDPTKTITTNHLLMAADTRVLSQLWGREVDESINDEIYIAKGMIPPRLLEGLNIKGLDNAKPLPASEVNKMKYEYPEEYRKLEEKVGSIEAFKNSDIFEQALRNEEQCVLQEFKEDISIRKQCGDDIYERIEHLSNIAKYHAVQAAIAINNGQMTTEDPIPVMNIPLLSDDAIYAQQRARKIGEGWLDWQERLDREKSYGIDVSQPNTLYESVMAYCKNQGVSDLVLATFQGDTNALADLNAAAKELEAHVRKQCGETPEKLAQDMLKNYEYNRVYTLEGYPYSENGILPPASVYDDHYFVRNPEEELENLFNIFLDKYGSFNVTVMGGKKKHLTTSKERRKQLLEGATAFEYSEKFQGHRIETYSPISYSASKYRPYSCAAPFMDGGRYYIYRKKDSKAVPVFFDFNGNPIKRHRDEVTNKIIIDQPKMFATKTLLHYDYNDQMLFRYGKDKHRSILGTGELDNFEREKYLYAWTDYDVYTNPYNRFYAENEMYRSIETWNPDRPEFEHNEAYKTYFEILNERENDPRYGLSLRDHEYRKTIVNTPVRPYAPNAEVREANVFYTPDGEEMVLTDHGWMLETVEAAEAREKREQETVDYLTEMRDELKKKLETYQNNEINKEKEEFIKKYELTGPKKYCRFGINSVYVDKNSSMYIYDDETKIFVRISCSDGLFVDLFVEDTYEGYKLADDYMIRYQKLLISTQNNEPIDICPFWAIPCLDSPVNELEKYTLEHGGTKEELTDEDIQKYEEEYNRLSEKNEQMLEGHNNSIVKVNNDNSIDEDLDENLPPVPPREFYNEEHDPFDASLHEPIIVGIDEDIQKYEEDVANGVYEKDEVKEVQAFLDGLAKDSLDGSHGIPEDEVERMLEEARIERDQRRKEEAKKKAELEERRKKEEEAKKKAKLEQLKQYELQREAEEKAKMEKARPMTQEEREAKYRARIKEIEEEERLKEIEEDRLAAEREEEKKRKWEEWNKANEKATAELEKREAEEKAKRIREEKERKKKEAEKQARLEERKEKDRKRKEERQRKKEAKLEKRNNANEIEKIIEEVVNKPKVDEVKKDTHTYPEPIDFKSLGEEIKQKWADIIENDEEYKADELMKNTIRQASPHYRLPEDWDTFTEEQQDMLYQFILIESPEDGIPPEGLSNYNKILEKIRNKDYSDMDENDSDGEVQNIYNEIYPEFDGKNPEEMTVEEMVAYNDILEKTYTELTDDSVDEERASQLEEYAETVALMDKYNSVVSNPDVANDDCDIEEISKDIDWEKVKEYGAATPEMYASETQQKLDKQTIASRNAEIINADKKRKLEIQKAELMVRQSGKCRQLDFPEYFDYRLLVGDDGYILDGLEELNQECINTLSKYMVDNDGNKVKKFKSEDELDLECLEIYIKNLQEQLAYEESPSIDPRLSESSLQEIEVSIMFMQAEKEKWEKAVKAGIIDPKIYTREESERHLQLLLENRKKLEEEMMLKAEKELELEKLLGRKGMLEYVLSQQYNHI